MTDEITLQTQQSLPKRDDKKQQPSNGAGGNRQGPKKSASGGRSASISAGAGNPRPSSRNSNRSASRRAPSTQGAADSGSESANAKKGDNRQRGKSQSGGPRGNGHRKGGQSTSQPGGGRPAGANGGNRQRQPSGSPAPQIASSESSDALSSLQRMIADLKTTSTSPPIQQQMPMQSATLAAASNLPANAPIFQPGAAAFPGSGMAEQPPRHRKAASLGAQSSSLGNSMGYSPNLGAMMEDVEDGQGGPIVEEGEIPENAYQSHPRRSLSQNFTAPRFQALAAQQQQEQSDAIGPTGRPQLAPGFMFGARRRPSQNLAMGPPINEDDSDFRFPQQSQQPNAFENLDTQRKADDRGDISGIMAEQVCTITVFYPCVCPYPPRRSPSKARSKLCNSNSKHSINNSSRQTRCCPSRPPAWPRAATHIVACTAPSP